MIYDVPLHKQIENGETLYIKSRGYVEEVTRSLEGRTFSRGNYGSTANNHDYQKRQYRTQDEADRIIARMRSEGKDSIGTLCSYYNPEYDKWFVGNGCATCTINRPPLLEAVLTAEPRLNNQKFHLHHHSLPQQFSSSYPSRLRSKDLPSLGVNGLRAYVKRNIIFF